MKIRALAEMYWCHRLVCWEVPGTYRPKHSTETALMKVQHDISNQLHKGRGVALVLLDLSAAFDTINPDGVQAFRQGGVWGGGGGSGPPPTQHHRGEIPPLVGKENKIIFHMLVSFQFK